MKTSVRQFAFLRELQTLARLIAMHPRVSVRMGKADEPGWRINWRTGVITVDPIDFGTRSSDYCRGLILHEAAHAAITRWHLVVPTASFSDAGIRELLNALEDARIETWLGRRHPGSVAWIHEYNDLNYRDVLANEGVRADKVAAFLIGLLGRWWYGDLPEDWPAAARDSVERVWDAFTRVVNLHPPTDIAGLHEMARAYGDHPVSRRCRAPRPGSERALVEAAARMTQWNAWEIVQREILPVFDEARAGRPVRRVLCRKIIIHVEGFGCDLPANAGALALGGGRIQLHASEPPPPDPANARLSYDQVVAELAREIDDVGDQLLLHLPAETRPRFRRYFPSGHRLDLAVAMQFEADPRLYSRLWQRRTLPVRPDPHFVVLIDTSTSMHGARIAGTQAAAILLREVCLRVGIPLSLITFACHARLVQPWNAADGTADARVTLGGLRESVHGSTNLTAGLNLAHAEFRDSRHRERYLWIISDGQPNDRSGALSRLRELTPGLSAALGLGMGPGTDALRTLLPHAASEVDPRRLPQVVGALLTRALGAE